MTHPWALYAIAGIFGLYAIKHLVQYVWDESMNIERNKDK